MGSNLTLFEWGKRIIAPVGSVLTQEMAREGTLLRAAELIHCGVTTVNDMFHHYRPGSFATLGVVAGLAQSGLRGSIAFGAEDLFTPLSGPGFTVAQAIEEHEVLADAVAAHELLAFRLGVGTMLGSSDQLLEASVALAHDRKWAVHTHLAEVREEIVEARNRWGCNTIERAAQLGLLDLDVIAAHLVWLNERDIALLAQHNVAGVHNPLANMILGSGVAKVPRLLAAGLRLGLGTDGAASNDSQNMLEVIKISALLQKVDQLDPAALSAEEALRMATLGGAEALGLEASVGSIEVGKRADIVLLENTAELACVHDPCGHVVYSVSPRSVADVWVDGRRLLSDRQLTTIDERAQIARCRSLAQVIAREAGLVAAKLSRLS
jgi:cytosine/adenosine deaminase-related metal-dependent hydrolase